MRRARVVGTVQRHGEALALVREPGDIAIVRRGSNRSIVMQCPDACGETITINLDPRTAKAWRIYENGKGVTLFPSVWRDTGCESHFILWDGTFFWMDNHDPEDSDPIEEARLDNLVAIRVIPDKPRHYVQIADELGEIPWAVLDSCRRLTRQGVAVAVDKDCTQFIRTGQHSKPGL